jgi:8-amino-7-oxononanoate synthase
MTPSNNTSLDWLGPELADLERLGLRRALSTRATPPTSEIVLDGVSLLNFGSNDYLGLAADPRLGAAAVEAIRLGGWGSGASPLITGHGDTHRRLEQRLAEFEGTEAALLFGSGFAANAGIIASLVGPGDVIYADRKNHASLWDGCRLSRADVRVYHHNDWKHLETLLLKADARKKPSSGDGGVAGNQAKDMPFLPKRNGRRLIVTDTLFSMDGDVAPLTELVELAKRFDAMLMIDEAHATGVFGKNGRGVAEALGVEERVPIRIGTLSKALGSVGGFVAGSRVLVDGLVNRARPYVFSTAAPAAVAAAAMAAIDIVRDEPQRREQLLARAAAFRDTLRKAGWNVGDSKSQIVPLIVGESGQAVKISQHLRQCGFYVPAIRPPTVPEGEACLRISLTAAHSEAMIERLLHTLGRCDVFLKHLFDGAK